MKKELILALNKASVLETLEKTKNVDEFFELLNESSKVFIPRFIAEESDIYIHPIPYFLITNEYGEVLVYQRGKGVGESRLLGNHSVGFGGHVDLQHVVDYIEYCELFVDEVSILDMIETSASVELDEELCGFLPVDVIEYLGIIYDDTNEVGKVHLGVVSKYTIELKDYNGLREEELIDCGWHKPEEILKKNGKEFNLENWSEIALKLL